MTASGLSRRNLGAVAAALLGLGARAGEAADCGLLPDTTVSWIVPFTAGGGSDVYSRLIEPFLERHLGRQVAVGNVTGAGGVVGSKAIRDAAPDGTTIGITDAGGLMMGRLSEGDKVRSPTRDFTVLGRIARMRVAWVIRADSPIRTMDDLVAEAAAGKLVIGVTDIGSPAFVSAAITAEILGFPVEFVAGYGGSADSALALMRGDVNLISAGFESMRESLETGELRAILQVSDVPIEEHASLAGVTLLAGPEGFARRRATALGRDPEAADASARLVIEVTGAGRVVMAPAGLSAPVATCLREALMEALADPEFAAAAGAGRSLDVANGVQALALLEQVEGRAAELAPMMKAAAGKVRG
jgi:tripartite-type tricarboxylate transporter receptor subunit TctC